MYTGNSITNIMKKQEILHGYDDLIQGKKQSRFAMILVIIFSTVISISALIFAFLIQIKSIDTVKVIDSSGRYLKSETQRRDQVLKASVQSHLDNVIHNLNSFDALSIKENQVKSIFLVDQLSANRVFDSYNVSGAYNDAMQNGVIYSSKMDKVTVFEGEKEPYSFEIEGLLVVKKGETEIKKGIKGKGKIRYVTPSYPNNVQGLQVYDYLQEFENIGDNENE